MKILRKFDMWLNSGKKKLPDEVREYLASVSTKTVYQKDIVDETETLDKLAEDYLYSEGIWRITEELRNCDVSPISEKDIYTTKNIFLLRCYYGQYITTYYFRLIGFTKIGNHWKYIGSGSDYEISRLLKPEEVAVNFIDNHGKEQQECCQHVIDTYYQY